MSVRQSPVRSRRPQRPPWMVGLLAGVALLVVIGLVWALVSLFRGDDSTQSEDSCVTVMVTPADSLPPASRVHVNVYNATDTAGLAGKIAKELSARDFKVVKVANDPRARTIAGVAQIRYGPKGLPNAQVLAYQVRGADLVADRRAGRTVDLAMGESFTALEPVDEVRAQMSVATPSASPAGCTPSS